MIMIFRSKLFHNNKLAIKVFFYKTKSKKCGFRDTGGGPKMTRFARTLAVDNMHQIAFNVRFPYIKSLTVLNRLRSTLPRRHLLESSCKH